jgi:hypothetical protein
MNTLIGFLILAHSFYSSECCSNRDCRPVACEEITPILGGWVWQHRIVFESAKLRVSEDGRCHVCISESVHSSPPPYGVCIYLPPGA